MDVIPLAEDVLSAVAVPDDGDKDTKFRNVPIASVEPEARLRTLSKSSIYEPESQYGTGSLVYAKKFPWLTNSELKEYKTYTRTCFDLSAIGPISVFLTIFYVSHANFEYALIDGPLFMCGLSFGLIASVLFYVVFIFAHGVRSLSDSGAKNIVMKGLSECIFHSTHLEDLIAILATSSAGCYLYARVLNGQCGTDVTLWGSQRCNPVAVSHSVPMDHVIYVYTFPLIHQLILRGISIQAVFVCWCISTAMISASVVHAGAWLDLWTIFSSLFVLCIAYEHERFSRVCFMQSKEVAEAEEQKHKRMVHHQLMEHDLSERNMLIERNNHEMEIISIRSDEERKRMSSEHAQMVSLIGNVAHDLKTPLQSVGIDLESLKAKLIAVNSILLQWFGHSLLYRAALRSNSFRGVVTCPNAIHPTPPFAIEDAGKEKDALNTVENTASCCCTKNRSNSDQSDMEFEAEEGALESDILALIHGMREGVTSVDYSCTFMKSAINRSLDFTKATKNIALSPSVSPFDIRETLSWPLKCVTSMQSEVAVTMAPLDPELSEVIFSDKHWLIENALCLLSNAVKYSSEGGTVQLTTELVLMRQTNEEGEVEITPVGNRQSDLDCSSNSNSATDSTSDSPIVGAFVCHNEDFPYETLVQAVAQSKINEKAISVMLAAAQEERTELMIRITVEDTGIGIPDDVKCCLFQPFAQAQRFAGGTGLGLYSLAKRIDALGGMYGVRDRDDGQSGTVFWFCFPYRPDFTTTTLTTPLNELAGESEPAQLSPKKIETKVEPKKGPSEISTTPLTTLGGGGGGGGGGGTNTGMRVLIVDDSMTILRVTARALNDAGFVVDTARNGFIGLNKMISTTFPHSPTSPTCTSRQRCHSNASIIIEAKDNGSFYFSHTVSEHEGERKTMQRAVGGVVICCQDEKKKEKEKEKEKGSYHLSTPNQIASLKKGDDFLDGSSDSLHPFDFILMDIQMPVMDGIEATLRLRARESAHYLSTVSGGDTDLNVGSSRLIIIGMSANSDAETKRLAHEAGMQYFLPKPFTIAEFIALLETIKVGSNSLGASCPNFNMP